MAVMRAGTSNRRAVWGLNLGEVRSKLGSVVWGSSRDDSLEEEARLGGIGVQGRTLGARGVRDTPRGEG